MQKYKAELVEITIEKVEVESETQSFVIIKKGKSHKREAKATQYCGYFDTYEEAKNFLISKISVDYNRAMAHAGYYKERLLKANEL